MSHLEIAPSSSCHCSEVGSHSTYESIGRRMRSGKEEGKEGGKEEEERRG